MTIALGIIAVYLAIGLAIYFTFPSRTKLPIHVTLPVVVAWLVLAIVFLFPEKKDPNQQKRG